MGRCEISNNVLMALLASPEMI